MADEQVFFVLVDEGFEGEHHGQVFTHLVALQTSLEIQVLKSLVPEALVELVGFQVFGCNEGLLEAPEGNIGEEVAGVTFCRVVFEAVVGEVGMGGEGDKANGDAIHEEDEPLRQREHILFNPGAGRFSLLVLNLFDGQDFSDWGHDVAEYVIFADDVGVGHVGIDDGELIMILVVPDHPIESVGDHFQGEVGFCGGEEQVDFSILVLQDELGSVLVGEDPEDRVIRFVLHHYAFVFDVVVLQSVGVVEIDEEHFGQEVLHHLPVTLHRENTFLSLTLNLNQVDLILVVQNSRPAVAHLHLAYVVLALDFVYFLPP